jgi:hypothetical protein
VGLGRAGLGPGRVGPAWTRVAHWCNHVAGSGSYWAFGSPGVAYHGLARTAHGPKDRFAVGSAHRSYLPLLVHSGPGAHGCSSPPPNSSIIARECPPAVNRRLGGYWSRVVHPPSFLRLGEGRAG